MGGRNTYERSPFTKPGFVVSAALLGMLVLAALFIWIGAATRDSNRLVAATHASGRLSATAAAGRHAAKPTGASCSLPAGSQAVPTVPPAMKWVTVGQMAVPQAPATYGPQREQNGIGVCFAHNPTGALLAAVNFFAQGTVADPATLIRTLAANTPSRTTALIQAQAGGDQLLQNSDGDAGSVQITGYEVVDYTAAQENVNVALEGPGGEMASVECQLDWQDNDWKFVIPSDGELTGSPITSTDGFVAWTNTNGGGQ